MTEEENLGVEEIATPPESEMAQEPAVEEQVSQPVQQSDADRNWAEARRKMRELEKIAEQQQQMIEKLTSKEAPEDDLSSLSDDDIVTAKQAKALAKKMAREAAEEVARRNEESTFESKLRQEYPDLDDVISTENIEKLKRDNPLVADSIKKISDPYAQAVMAYNVMKNMTKPTQDRAKAALNAKKPVSGQAIAKQASPMGNVGLYENGLTAEVKANLYKEMQEAARGI